jgi:CHAD domain-containing protein
MEKVINNQAKTFGDWAYLAITKHFNKILKNEGAVLKDKDPEDLHQMRVGMRRLRSTIVGCDRALNLPKVAGEKKVGQVAKILGTLRDIDVLGDGLENQYKPSLPDKEKKDLERALKVLSKQRKKAFREVKTILESDLYFNLKKAFQDWLDNPSYQEIAQIAIEPILPDLLLPQVSHLLLHPGWLVGVKFKEGEVQFPDGLEQKEVEELLDCQGLILHDLRKEAKRSRYNMELFTQFYGENYQNYVKDIKEIQTVLGEIQDCFILAEFLTGVFPESLSREMPTLMDKLRETRYQKWQEWEVLQRKFLNPETRKDFHLTVGARQCLAPTKTQKQVKNFQFK